jgi:hypothetical protein
MNGFFVVVDTLLRRPCSVLVEYQTVIARPEPEVPHYQFYSTLNLKALQDTNDQPNGWLPKWQHPKILG